MIHKKILFYASLLAVVIVLILYHRGVSFDKSYNGILYSNEDAFEKKTTIRIEGELYKRLSGKHRIVGNVTVDEDLTYRFAADLDGPEYVHHIAKWDDNKHPRTEGSIHISKDISMVWIRAEDFDAKYGIMEGYAFGPAGNKVEVKDAISKMIAK